PESEHPLRFLRNPHRQPGQHQHCDFAHRIAQQADRYGHRASAMASPRHRAVALRRRTHAAGHYLYGALTPAPALLGIVRYHGYRRRLADSKSLLDPGRREESVRPKLLLLGRVPRSGPHMVRQRAIPVLGGTVKTALRIII